MTGLRRCENFIVRPQGGVYSRPGTRFIGQLDDSSRKARLIEFSFNTEQTYILVFEHLKMRVIKDGGYILDGGSIYETVTPYTEDQLPRLKHVQDADVMTIVHPDHDPKYLKRLSEVNWTLTDVDFSPTVESPTWVSTTDFNITNITNANPAIVTLSTTFGLSTGNNLSFDDIVDDNTSGVNTLEDYINGRSFDIEVLNTTQIELIGSNTIGLDGYVSGGVASKGNISGIGSGCGDYSKTYSYVVTAVDENGIESLPSSEVSIVKKSLSTTCGVQLEWNAVTGADYYRVYKDPSSGTDYYGWIGDSRTTVFNDYNKAPITSDSPPQDRQPFNGALDKPAVVSYYQQRAIYANTYNEPQTVFTSQTGVYDSMRSSSPSRDDDAITFTVKAQQVNEIRHIIPMDRLILLTSGGEFGTTEGQDQVLTPSTIGVRPQSFNGASWVDPVIINSTALYLQDKGTKIRDLAYDFSSDKYTGNDLSLMSEHLFKDHLITDMTFSSEPFGIVWCVRDDGILLGLTYQREHQVWGWHQHSTDGQVESIATISEDGRDAVYMIVKRQIDGNDVRYVERMEPRTTANAADAFCVDSGLTYEGSPVTEISGLDHLEGKELAVVADGNSVTGLVVQGGSITLPIEASKVVTGLPFTPVVETLDIENSGIETYKTKRMSVSEVTVEFEDSRGGYAGSILDDGGTSEMIEMLPRFISDGYGPVTLKSYKHDVVIPSEWAKTGAVRIEQRSPYPMAILSIIPEVNV